MTRLQLKTRIAYNLGDVGEEFYSSTDLNDSIQDFYDEVAVRTGCISKTGSIVVVPGQVYYNLAALIPDFYECVAIFNPTTNLFLNDSTPVRGFDNIRSDWENWTGNFQFWAPVSPTLIATIPAPAAVTTSLVLYYNAQAPTITLDSDSFLLQDDLMESLEYAVTGDMLAQSEEFTKAQIYLNRYEEHILPIVQRYKNMAKADLLLRLGGQ